MRLKKEKEIRDFYKNQAETARLRSKLTGLNKAKNRHCIFLT